MSIIFFFIGSFLFSLFLAYSDSVNVIDTAYNQYVWDSQLITNSGVYTNTFTNISGCDSIVVLDLTIINLSDVSELHDFKNQRFKITNVLGQEVTFRKNIPLLYLFENGRVEKKIIIEK